uniref:Ion_trans domain-containing protein n=1 Tax=Macrostomum lignano TaxID=282301 RepID=A0A1I8IXE0_9PLAT
LGQFLSSPSVKFQYHLLSHLVLLALLTSTVLFHFHSRLNRLETLIAVWFVGLVVEEAIECRNCKSPLIYLGDMWNVMDLASIGLFYLGFFAKLGLDLTTGAEVERMSCVPDFVDSRYYWIRVLYCVCLFLLYCRLLFYAVIFKAIGPKIRMICEMLVTDLLPFLLVLGIFMAAFGVSLQSLLYPNGYYQRRSAPRLRVTRLDLHSSRWEMQRVWVNLIEKAFYITVGEFFVEELKGLACEEAGCPHEIGRVLVPTALNFLFILVTNVLLLNLLIALFSKTVDQIHGNSTSVWYYSRHYTVEEFQRRLALPPPLNILQAVYLLLQRLRAPRCLHNTRLGRHRATMLRRLRGVRRESAVLKFVYYLAVQAVAMRSKRAELYLGLVKSNRSRHFTESTGETAAAATPAEQLQQQQPPIQAVERRLASLDDQMKDLRSMLEKILQQQQQQQQQTLEVPPPPNYQLQVHATESSSEDATGDGSQF